MELRCTQALPYKCRPRRVVSLHTVDTTCDVRRPYKKCVPVGVRGPFDFSFVVFPRHSVFSPAVRGCVPTSKHPSCLTLAQHITVATLVAEVLPTWLT
jgi:hypothetical protein